MTTPSPALAAVALVVALGGGAAPEARTAGDGGAEALLAAAKPPDPAVARRTAREILSERRFRRTEVRGPLHGFLHWLGERLRSVTRPLARLADRVPGRDSTLWAVLAAAVMVGALLVSTRLARARSARAASLARASRAGAAAVDPERLEREADDAERRREFERALRLRFRAGLLRLDRAQAIQFRESLTAGEVARSLRSRDFETLAASFDEVVYGRRPARDDDVRRARETWPRIVAQVSGA